jgi:hypothetical protein
MTTKLTFVIALIMGLFYTANGQIMIRTQQGLNSRVQDNVLGISFAKVGTVVKLDSSTYSINLLSSGTSPAQSAIALMSVSDKLFIDLPGSYGGRVYLDSPSAARLFKDRVMVDSVNTGQLNFRREYWAVYAGMGMWDCVINSYVKKNGRYYIVSLVQDKPIGKPGEIVNGKSLKAEDLELKVVSSLQDTTNSIVHKFNKLLFSFRIHK